MSGITGANVTVPETTASTTSGGSPSGATNTPAHTTAHSGAIKGRGIGKRIINCILIKETITIYTLALLAGWALWLSMFS